MIDAETLALIPTQCRGCDTLIGRLEEDKAIGLPQTDSIDFAKKLCRGRNEDGSCGHAGIAIFGIVGAIAPDMLDELRSREL